MARARLAAAFVVLVVSSMLLAPPVFAHGRLESATPAPGSHLTAPPHELRLTFTEAPELSETTIRLVAPDGGSVALGAPASVGGRTVVVALASTLAPGRYRVVWHTMAADGHPTHGEFEFMVMAAGSGPEAAAAITPPGVAPAPHAHHMAPAANEFDASSPAYVVIRFLFYTALLTLIGALAFRIVVLGWLSRDRTGVTAGRAIDGGVRSAATLGAGASAAVLALALARLLAQSVALHGADEALAGDRLAMMIGHTLWGWAWVLQVAAAAVALGAFARARRGGGPAWILAALAGIALAFSSALSAHAASSRYPFLAVIADAMHVIGAAGWLGSLLVLLLAGLPTLRRTFQGDRAAAVAELVNAFSPTALFFAGLTAATGVLAAWLQVGHIPALWGTAYGRTLLLKLAVLAAVGATGAYNWLRVKPVLGSEEASLKLRRSATLELVIGTVVLLVTAVLVALPTPVAR